jgi:ribosomal protein S18 acetylase RimI-like enzyme
MSYTVVPATETELPFAHNLTRDNMAPYYECHGRIWNPVIFESSWPTTENYCLYLDDVLIGILRCSQSMDCLYVRDIQILPQFQNSGAGTFALAHANALAMIRELKKIQLRVFAGNRAVHLYRRLGFAQIRDDNGLLLLEKIVA